MAYTRRRQNSGQQNQWGQQNYDISPDPVYGQIKRGPAPPQNRFQGPRMLPAPNYTGANKPLADSRAPAGTFTNMINNAASNYVGFQEKKRETVMRKSMKLARANNKVQALRTAKAFGLGPTGTPSTALPPPVGTTWGAPTGRRPARTSLPPPAGSTPAPPAGGPTPPPIPPTTPPVGGPIPPWTGTPPKAPRTTRGAGTPSTPFDLPPLSGSGGDFFTESIKRMGDVDSPTPTSVDWKDDPLNPFPEGKFKPFDSSRMFDPTYKPSEEMTSPAASRTKSRKPKTSRNPLDEMTGPISKEGRDPDGTDPDLAAKARKTFF
jgi:hypothetical protein